DFHFGCICHHLARKREWHHGKTFDEPSSDIRNLARQNDTACRFSSLRCWTGNTRRAISFRSTFSGKYSTLYHFVVSLRLRWHRSWYAARDFMRQSATSTTHVIFYQYSNDTSVRCSGTIRHHARYFESAIDC